MLLGAGAASRRVNRGARHGLQVRYRNVAMASLVDVALEVSDASAFFFPPGV